MVYSKVLNRSRTLSTLLQQPRVIRQVCHFHRISITPRLVSLSPNKFSSSNLRQLTATNFTFTRYSSNNIYGKQSSTAVDNGYEPLDLTEDVILEPPEVLPVEAANEFAENTLNALGEETLQSVGLGSSYTPVGLLQNALEFMHVSCGLPWWGAIIAGTTILRLLVFPLVISSQRHTVKMNYNLPQIQAYQRKMTEARLRGDDDELGRTSYEFMLFMKTHQISPLKGMMMLPVVQFPIFLSMFLGLRNMSMLPLESFKNGGVWWFTDITMPDPYYILPIVTVITLGVTLQLSVNANKLNAAGAAFGKFLTFGIRVLPVVMLPFIVNFPCAICIYWASTNFFSLGQVLFFKVPSVRNYFNIDVIEKVGQSQQINVEDVEELKKSTRITKIVKEIEERERLDHMKFTQSNHASPVKTFKYNPKVEGGLKKED